MISNGDDNRSIHHSEKRAYAKPELTSYEHADLGFYSPANSDARCQANCALNTCTLIETCSLAPCAMCDMTNECGTGMNPNLNCFPWAC